MFKDQFKKIKNKRQYLLIAIALATLVGAYFVDMNASAEDYINLARNSANLPIIGQNTLLPLAETPPAIVSQKIKVMVTGYSSTVEQTDDTPFTTASNKTVRDGIIANNLLRFGDMVRLPDLFGDKVFVVEDRMHRRKGFYHVDIWFPTEQEAIEFGAKISYMEILANK